MNIYIGNQTGFPIYIIITELPPTATRTEYALHVYKEKPEQPPIGKLIHKQLMSAGAKRIECSGIPDNSQFDLTPHLKPIIFRVSKFVDGDIAIDIDLEN